MNKRHDRDYENRNFQGNRDNRDQREYREQTRNRDGRERNWSFENYPEGNYREYNSQQNTAGYRDRDSSHYQSQNQNSQNQNYQNQYYQNQGSQNQRDYDDNRERNARAFGEEWPTVRSMDRGVSPVDRGGTESWGYGRDYSRTGSGDYNDGRGYGTSFSNRDVSSRDVSSRSLWNRDEWNRDPGRNMRDEDHESLGDKVRRFFGKGPKGYKRSDERIREDVCDHLSDGWIDASDIEVSVKDGEVTLTGTVTERRMKHIAEDMVERVSGVQDVHNQIRVKKEGSTTLSNTELAGTGSTTQQGSTQQGSTQQGSSQQHRNGNTSRT
jgi:hypothetical protein